MGRFGRWSAGAALVVLGTTACLDLSGLRYMTIVVTRDSSTLDHWAVGLGLKAIERGYRVLFTTAAALIASLTRALAEGRLDDRLKVYTVPGC